MKITLVLIILLHAPYSFAQIPNGQYYLIIGNQVWSKENLTTTKFRNGDVIPEAKTREEWVKAGEEGNPAWCYFDNDPKNGEKYGRIYNGFAITDPRGLIQSGWHLPTETEWRELIKYLGGDAEAGSKLKASSGWLGEGNGTNSSGFNALPGGLRYSDGSWYPSGYAGRWWSSSLSWSNNNDHHYWSLSLTSGNNIAELGSSVYKQSGLSVRCIKD